MSRSNKRRWISRRICCATVLLLLQGLLGRRASAQNWPLTPITDDHPIGNTFGEYIDATLGPYQHTGVDILGDALSTSSYAVVTTMGSISRVVDNPPPDELNNQVEILAGGNIHRYIHLAHGTFKTPFASYAGGSVNVPAETLIAQLVSWPSCIYYDHLHYELVDSATELNVINPMIGFLDPDLSAPKCDGIHFAEDDASVTRWKDFPEPMDASIVVSGKVDIVIKAWDDDDAGKPNAATDTTWMYRVRWRACTDDDADCPWNEEYYAFDSFPLTWGTKDNDWTDAYFSSEDPWISSDDYCTKQRHYAVVTNLKDGEPNKAGCWNTSGLSGAFTVTVEVKDFAGNAQNFNARVCVDNTGKTTELMIRDSKKDRGALPFLGGSWLNSPDIQINPGGTLPADTLKIGAMNTIKIEVRNNGSKAIPPGSKYDVCLAVRTPQATAIPHPIVAPAQSLKCVTEMLTTPWVPGTSRFTTLEWIPDTALFSAGKYSLVAWVDHKDDPVLSTASVEQDDNRAQRDVKLAP